MTATDWLDDAACAGADAHLWFSEVHAERQQAAAICRGCPVLDRLKLPYLETERPNGQIRRPVPRRRESGEG